MPQAGFNLGQSRMAVFQDCQATALTTQPPRLVLNPNLNSTKLHIKENPLNYPVLLMLTFFS